MRLHVTISVMAVAAVASAATHAQKAGFGTPAEAKAMLEKVVISMKADPAKTVSQINKGEGGFPAEAALPAGAACVGRLDQ